MSRSPTRAACVLFFPGDRPELLEKAVASGARRVCMDLEDAVAADAKGAARAEAVALLSDPDADPEAHIVRVSHPDTPDGQADLEAIGRLGLARVTVMVPKVSSVGALERVHGSLASGGAEVALVPVIETARGLAGVEEILAGPSVREVVFGGLDLSADLGCETAWEPLLYARSRTVHAARLAGVGAIDTPWFDVGDLEGLRAECLRARALGFATKAAIHPAQVPVIDEAFAPAPEEVASARRIVEAVEREGEGVLLVDGMMVDRPVIERARDLLRWADARPR